MSIASFTENLVVATRRDLVVDSKQPFGRGSQGGRLGVGGRVNRGYFTSKLRVLKVDV